MKLAMIFPGIGYTCDKPLLYYSQKLLSSEYEVIRIQYGQLPKIDIKDVFEIAYQRVWEMYKDFDFSKYDSILCISKSVGTAISTRLDQSLNLQAKHVLYTPIEITFRYARSGIAFSGTKDPWVEFSIVQNNCDTYDIPLYVYPDCNHSLECQNIEKDLQTIQEVMKYTLKFLETL